MLPVKSCAYKIDHVSSNGAAPHFHHANSEIIQCFENSGSILINGELYKMKKNGLYFIHGLDTHFVSPEDINRYNHSIMIIDTPEIQRMFENLGIKEEFKQLFTSHGGTFCELSDEAVIETDKIFLNISNILKDNDGMKYARLAAQLIRLTEIGFNFKETEEKHNDKLSDVFTFINDNALNKLSMDEICEKTHISKYHLCRIFKENMGVTITEFIKNRRLSVAKQLLINSQLKITEIAQKCGFCDSSFFTKVFTKEFSITPTEYRAKYR